VKQFYRVDGNIINYKLHPSNEYVIILSDKGFYYIFNIDQGDIRAKQLVDASSKDMEIDSSGLYLSVVSNTNEIHIYELAKGNLVGVLKTEMDSVSLHQFAGTGQEYIVVDASSNNVRFFTLDIKIYNLITKVLIQMAQNPNFWSDFPIYLNNISLLSKSEKNAVKQHKLNKKGGDSHSFHPFLEQSIIKANKLNQTILNPLMD
jgi:WD40 repeat protein